MSQLSIGPIDRVYNSAAHIEIYEDHVVKIANRPEENDRIWNEAAFLKLMYDEGVSPRLIEQGEENGVAYIKMQRMDGTNLSQSVFQTDQNLDGTALSIIHNLSCIHENGIFHRDFKPDNLMVEADGNVRVLDFGSAIDFKGNPAEQRNFVFSTPCIVPPELFTHKSSWSKGAEVFSLGVVLYRLYTGKYPFGNGTVESVAENACFSEPEPFSGPMWPLVHNCLIKDPNLRYRSTAEVLADFLSLQKGVQVRLRGKKSGRSWVPRGRTVLALLVVISAFILSLDPGILMPVYLEKGSEFRVPKSVPVFRKKLEYLQELQLSRLVPIKIKHVEGNRKIRIKTEDYEQWVEEGELLEVPAGVYLFTFRDPEGKSPDVHAMRRINMIGTAEIPLKINRRNTPTDWCITRPRNVVRDSHGFIDYLSVGGYQGRTKEDFKVLRYWVDGEKQEWDFRKLERPMPSYFVIDWLERSAYRLPTQAELQKMKPETHLSYLCFEVVLSGNVGKVLLVPRTKNVEDTLNYQFLRRD